MRKVLRRLRVSLEVGERRRVLGNGERELVGCLLAS